METKKSKKISDYYYDSKGRKIISNYEDFYKYVSKHTKYDKLLYTEWLTFDNLIIVTMSAYFDSTEMSVTKIERDSI